MKPILVIGSYLAGLTMRVPAFPVAGETLLGSDYSAMHGGKGSNQAVACARLGAQAAFAGCVGRDAFGEGMLRLHAAEGVDTTHTRAIDEYPTGCGFILVNDAGENIITLDTGACKAMEPALAQHLKQAIAGSAMVLMQLEIPSETVAACAHMAASLGVPVLLNPAPFAPLPQDIYPHLNLVTPNLGEARRMLGLAPEDDALPPPELARRIHALGIEQVVLTLGNQGAYFLTGTEEGHVPAVKVQAVDTTGAGDTFAAALAVALTEGRSLKEAVVFAAHAAALSVTRYGVIDSLPYRSDVDSFAADTRAGT